MLRIGYKEKQVG